MRSNDIPTSIDETEIPAPTPLPTNGSNTSAKDEAKKEPPLDATPETEAEKKEKAEQAKRFIPEHKKPDAALTFPEKLMSLMKLSLNEDPETFCIAWLPDGKSFVIRNPDEFTRKVLPLQFKATKFSSFTRKLYRWGFRQVNRGIGPDDPIIFGNEFFQRDNLELMAKMRSITAASTRKQEEGNFQVFAQKRALESMTCMQTEQAQKRILLDQFMKQKAVMNTGMFSNNNGGMNMNMNMNLTQALRPGGFNGLGGQMDMSLNMSNMFNQFNTPNPMMGSMSSFPQAAFGGFNSNQNQPQGFSNPTSTADIVNAAINALRFAP